jgi:CubicO group peptidase (beta-lactamase class C family)
VYGDVNRRTWMRSRLPHLASAGPHRDSHRYSNMLYAVLGLLIEEKTGKTWEADLQEFCPEGVRLFTPESLNDVEVPYARTGEGMIRLPDAIVKEGHPIAPASELVATLPALAQWGLEMLPVLDTMGMARPQCPVPGARPHPSMGPLTYGLGWRLDTVSGHRRIWHSGQCSGYAALLSLDPENGRVVAAACNLNGSVDVLHALDLWIREGIEPDWAEIPCRRTSPQTLQPSPAGSLPTGVYTNPGYGSLELREEPEGVVSLFQGVSRSPVWRQPNGQLLLELPEYGVRFPLRLNDAEEIRIPFESGVKEIPFLRKT